MNTEIVEVRENKSQLGFPANENFREKKAKFLANFFAKFRIVLRKWIYRQESKTVAKQ